MVAFPFQPSPTFAEYREWLIGEGGQAVDGSNEWGSFTQLSSPDNRRRVTVPGIEPDERLVPSKIELLDLRLGLVSPWSASYTN